MRINTEFDVKMDKKRCRENRRRIDKQMKSKTVDNDDDEDYCTSNDGCETELNHLL